MARTAPAPNIPPIPGMCPFAAVKGGGGAGGGSGGGGAGSGGGGTGKGAGAGKDGAPGGKKGAASGSPDGKKYEKQSSEGEPIDVATGRVYTLPTVDLALPGPLPFRFTRSYSSHLSRRDVGFGFGWTHSFAWRIELRRRVARVWTPTGVWVELPLPTTEEPAAGLYGWSLRRKAASYELNTDDGLRYEFLDEHKRGRELHLSSVANRCGQRITLRYDEAGRLAEIADSVARRIRFVLDDNGRHQSLEVLNAAARGQWLSLQRYAYDTHGNLVAAQDADGHERRYAYGRAHRLKSHTDGTGLTFHFRYDRQGRGIETWGDYGDAPDPALSPDAAPELADGSPAKGIFHVRISYHPDGYREVVSARQIKHVFTNALGTVDLISSGGGEYSAQYDDAGLLVSETDALGSTTAYTRDELGQLASVTDPLGRVTSYERNDAGDLARTIDPAGGVRETEHDRRGQLTRSINAAGGITALSWDERGLLTQIQGPDGNLTRMGYDGHGNCVWRVDPNGGTWRWTYDFLGRVLTETDPDDVTRSYRYSARGEIVAEIYQDQSSRQFGYDGEGHLVERVEPNGARWQWRWGGFHNACERIDPCGRRVVLRYGREGELLEAIDENGSSHHLEYDELGNLIREVAPDGRTTRYQRDRAGRVVRREIGRFDAVDITYDAASQVVEKSYADDSFERFSYDALGDVVAVERPDGTCRFQRDPLGRVVAEEQVIDDETFSVSGTLTPTGQRHTLQSSLGFEARFERDAAGNVTRTILDGSHHIDHRHDPLRREVHRQLPGGGVIERNFDEHGRLVRQTITSTTAGAREQQLRYGDDDRLVAATNTAAGDAAFSYDTSGRLITAQTEQAQEQLAYDAAGNLTARQPQQPSWRYQSGHLLQRDDTRYEWDDDGRLVARTETSGDDTMRWEYQWDTRGLLAAVVRPDGAEVGFAYDAFGRRTQKTFRPVGAAEPTARTIYIWDGDQLVHEVVSSRTADGSNDKHERTFAYAAPWVPLAQRDRDPASSTSSWAHVVTNQIGTVEWLVDGNGTQLADLKSPLRAQGQQAEPETGLIYNRHRYFDPEGGRFISPDPKGLAADINLYARGCDPNQDVDPLGLTRRPGTPVSSLSDSDPVKKAYNHATDESRWGYKQKDMKCAKLALALECELKADPETDLTSKRLRMNPTDGGTLDTHPDVGIPGRPWGHHAAAELSDGRVVDVDQGLIFDDKEHWKSETVTDPSKVAVVSEK